MHCDNDNGDHDDEDSGWVKLPLHWVQLLLQVVPNEFMDLLQSSCRTGQVIFCNVFLHTVCKIQDLLQLSQPLCLTQLLAAFLSPCKHLQNELHSSFLHILTTLCSLACTLTTTHHFLSLKAPDMIQRFPFLVHLVHTVWLFLHDTPDFWGGQISDKTRIIWVASKVFIKGNMSH